jgi:DNA-binding NtrC family response regulator
MCAARLDRQSLINPVALESLLEALEGKSHEFKSDGGLHFRVALKALNNGVSLTEIIQRATWQLEKHVITQILASTNGNKSKAARILKIDYKTLYRKLQKYVI